MRTSLILRNGNAVSNRVRLCFTFKKSIKMGRKIPGKKHKTIKDPYKQRQRRLDSIRLKINNPPSKSGEQEIPKSLLKIMELKTKAKQTALKEHKRKYNRPPNLSMAKVLNKESYQGKKKSEFSHNLVPKPNESPEGLLRRLNAVAQNLINEVEFEKKFGVKIKKNPETGKVIEVKKIKKKNKSKKKKLSEKRKEKLDQKKENLQNIKDFNQLKDKVEFGEVVHRPPDLSKIKKNENKIQKPNYSDLVLNSVVKNIDTKNKNVKRNLEKEKKESEREFIIEAYRKVKRNKTV